MDNKKRHYSVRPATVVDVEDIVAMWAELALLHSGYNADRWRWSRTAADEFKKHLSDDLLSSPNAVTLVAVDDRDRVFGFIAALVGKAANVLAAKTRAEITDLFVLPEARGHKVATMLIDRTIEIFKVRKAAYIVLSVACGNDEAMELYNKYGFEPCMVQLFKQLDA